MKRKERRIGGSSFYIYQFRSALPDFFKEGEIMDFIGLQTMNNVYFSPLSIEEMVIRYYLIVCFPILLVLIYSAHLPHIGMFM